MDWRLLSCSTFLRMTDYNYDNALYAGGQMPLSRLPGAAPPAKLSVSASPGSLLGVAASARQACLATAPHASLTVTKPTTSHPSSADFTYATSPNHSRGEQRCHCPLACHPRARLQLPRCCTIRLRQDRFSRHLHVPSIIAHSHAASHPYVTSHHGRTRGYAHLWRRAQGMSALVDLEIRDSLSCCDMESLDGVHTAVDTYLPLPPGRVQRRKRLGRPRNLLARGHSTVLPRTRCHRKRIQCQAGGTR